MTKLQLIIPLIFLVSCNSYYFPLLIETPERIINSFRTYTPGEDYIENQEYSFITVELGQQNATLVLGSIENNVFTWLGRDNVVFETYRGFIIKSIGLEHNFEIVDPIQSIDKVLSNGTGNIFYNFDNPRLFGLEALITRFNKTTDQVSISLKSNDINWNVKFNVSYNSNGLAISANQTLHPFLSPAKLRFFYKY